MTFCKTPWRQKSIKAEEYDLVLISVSVGVRDQGFNSGFTLQ